LRIVSVIWFSEICCFFFSSRRRHTRSKRDWSSDVCSSDLIGSEAVLMGTLVSIRTASLPMWKPTFSAPNSRCRVPDRMCSPVCCCILSNRQAQSICSSTGVPGTASGGRVSTVCQITPSFSRSEEHTSELQSRFDLVCRLLLEKKKNHHCT